MKLSPVRGRRAPRIEAEHLQAFAQRVVEIESLERIAHEYTDKTRQQDAGVRGRIGIAEFDQPEEFARLVADFMSGEAIAAVA